MVIYDEQINLGQYNKQTKSRWLVTRMNWQERGAKNEELEKIGEESSIRHLWGKLDELLKNRSKEKNKQTEREKAVIERETITVRARDFKNMVDGNWEPATEFLGYT